MTQRCDCERLCVVMLSADSELSMCMCIGRISAVHCMTCRGGPALQYLSAKIVIDHNLRLLYEPGCPELQTHSTPRGLPTPHGWRTFEVTLGLQFVDAVCMAMACRLVPPFTLKMRFCMYARG